MKVLIILFTVICLFSSNIINAQTQDTLKSNIVLKQSIIPVVLIGSGVLINHSQFEKNVHTDLRNAVGNNYEFKIDNYIQYAPAAEIYIADIAGIKSKNHWFDQTKYLLISQLITSSITEGLKHLTLKTRPNGQFYSFPSGHTTFAFTNATVLYNEFSESSPLLAYSGYVFSTTTGIYRMLNNKHWFSDVLVGAGIGILVTNLVYYFKPFKNFNPFKKNEGLVVIPQVGNNSYGVYFSYSFK